MRLRCFDATDGSKDFFSRLSKPPKSRSEFDHATEFILGHFTSSAFLESILQYGLIPDTENSRSTNDRLLCDKSAVYLTTGYDKFYAERAVNSHGGRPIVIQVLVNRASLAADENSLNQHDMNACSPDEALYRSMCFGACKHTESISLDAILSISEIDGSVLHEIPTKPNNK